jgi:hypothetical protein
LKEFDMKHCLDRRDFLGAGLGLVLPAAVWAQATAPVKVRALGVYSLLGNLVNVTVAERPTDTNIKRAARESIEVASAAFDTVALRSIREVAQRELPAAKSHFYRSPTALSPTEQRKVLSDARSGGLPAWMVQTIEQNNLGHVLLLTRGVAPANARSDEPGQSTVGRANVDGLGFYVDPIQSVRNRDTGAISEGTLAPHIVVQLSLMDVNSAEIVRNHTINDQWLHAPRENLASPDPWLQMDDVKKVETLREALERNLQRVIPGLLKG